MHALIVNALIVRDIIQKYRLQRKNSAAGSAVAVIWARQPGIR